MLFSLFFSFSFSFFFFFLHKVSAYHGEHWATGLVSEKKNHVHLNEVFLWGVQHRRDTCAAWLCISIGPRAEAKTERLEVRWLFSQMEEGAWCWQRRLKKEVPGDLLKRKMASVMGIQVSVSKYACDGTKVGGVGAWEAVIGEMSYVQMARHWPSHIHSGIATWWDELGVLATQKLH